MTAREDAASRKAHAKAKAAMASNWRGGIPLDIYNRAAALGLRLRVVYINGLERFQVLGLNEPDPPAPGEPIRQIKERNRPGEPGQTELF